MSYDIYLQTVCRAQPDLDDLLVAIPALGTSPVQEKLTPYLYPPKGVFQRLPPQPGFLGLDLEEAQAHELFRRLTAVGAQGEVLLAAYRNPQITQEQGLQIAEPELRRICQERRPMYHFEPVRLWKEEPRYWVFHTVSRQLQKEGWIPGGPAVSIDKVDGHIY